MALLKAYSSILFSAGEKDALLGWHVRSAKEEKNAHPTGLSTGDGQ